ncbi:unnamed protein product [Orchesella dallaii]|uniref:Uncharacterized protein n=1 Tax=Orchesella dallaii TaxID=48710 RepID=A0ABP1RQ79_9HEXA
MTLSCTLKGQQILYRIGSGGIPVAHRSGYTPTPSIMSFPGMATGKPKSTSTVDTKPWPFVIAVPPIVPTTPRHHL